MGHWRLDTPTIAEIEEALVDPRRTGLKIMYTELDINLLAQAGRGGNAGRSRRSRPSSRC